MKKAVSILLCACLIVCASPVYAASASDFSDVSSSAWYYDAVDYAVSKGLFSGTSSSSFSPQEPMTRGMFTAVLGRYCGAAGYAAGSAVISETINMRSGPGTDYSIVKTLYKGSSADVYSLSAGWYKASCSGVFGYIRADLIKPVCASFSDVPVSKYYAPFVNWAFENGIVSGTSASDFSPDREITREQLCAVLYRLVSKRSLTLRQTAARQTFSDESAISPSFRESVYALQTAGIVSGRGNGSFCPAASASRAEVASILKRFIENTGSSPSVNYGYSGTVPESASVADSYFDDACFIGHSLVQGMQVTFNLSKSDYYAVNGIAASTLLTYSDFALPDGGTGTISDALSQKNYGKIYVMLGVNELGGSDYDRQNFYNSMSSLVSLIKQKQPAAKVYIISLTPVTKAESDSSSVYNLANVAAFNTLLQKISSEKNVGYLDFFTLFADSDGYMPQDGAASDGIHPVQSQYAVMKQYIKTHTY